MSEAEIDFGDYIASYANFPIKDILFRDISPLLASPTGMALALDAFTVRLADFEIDLIAGIESRGFLFSTLLASRLGIGSMMIRKPGKLPGTLIRTSYALEYGVGELAMQETAPVSGRSVLIIDDLLATGGTAVAAKSLLISAGARVPACAVVVELAGLGGSAALGVPIVALKRYDD